MNALLKVVWGNEWKMLNEQHHDYNEIPLTTVDDYLRKVLRSPACVMATSVLVTDVPMLVPMIIGTASCTDSTAKGHKVSISPLSLSSTSPSCIHAYLLVSMCSSSSSLRVLCVCVLHVCALTSWWHHADDYRGGSGRALDQQGDQNSNNQTSQRVGQHWVILKDVSCRFTWTWWTYTNMCVKKLLYVGFAEHSTVGRVIRLKTMYSSKVKLYTCWASGKGAGPGSHLCHRPALLIIN